MDPGPAHQSPVDAELLECRGGAPRVAPLCDEVSIVSENKRLEIVHTESSQGWGGQEIRILDESKGLGERGHRVTVLCPIESTIHARAVRAGIPVVGLPIGRKSLQGILSLRRWLAARRPDLVNTHSSTDSWLVALALLMSRFRPPVIRTRHVSTPIHNNWPTRWLYTHATRHIVTTGDALRDQLMQVNGYDDKRICSVPTGIDPRRFLPGDAAASRRSLNLPSQRRIIGILATLRSWKGHRYLLDACAQLRDRQWQLVIVGDGPVRQNLMRHAEDIRLADRVMFVGHCDNPEIWLQAMDIFALPSYANEGVPQALVQAMLTELPVVTTNVGAIPEVVRHNETGLIVPPKNAARLSEAIATLIDDHVLRRRLGMAARVAVYERYCRRRMLDDMEALFLKLARSDPGG